jgi:hypothetical protein
MPHLSKAAGACILICSKLSNLCTTWSGSDTRCDQVLTNKWTKKRTGTWLSWNSVPASDTRHDQDLMNKWMKTTNESHVSDNAYCHYWYGWNHYKSKSGRDWYAWYIRIFDTNCYSRRHKTSCPLSIPWSSILHQFVSVATRSSVYSLFRSWRAKKHS